MKKLFLYSVFIVFLCSDVKSQIDTVIFEEIAVHLFPSLPVKSSVTSVIDHNGNPYVYSANIESGLGIYEISSEVNIDLVLNITIDDFHGLDVSTVRQKNEFLYAGIGDFQIDENPASGLAIIDVSVPNVPVIRDVWDTTIFNHGVSHVLVDGDYAYLATMSDGIFILDVSNPDAIKYKSKLQLDLDFPSPSNNAHNARGMQYRNDSLFVCFDRGGLRLVDVSDKTNPVEIYSYINTELTALAAAAYNDIYISGNYAFVSIDYCGLEILDISETPFTNVQWYNPWGCNFFNWSGADIHANELRGANNDSLLFVSAGQSDVIVMDITDPPNARKIGQFSFVDDVLAVHGIDVYQGQVSLSMIHTPIHIPPFTPFFADPGGLKLLNYEIQLESTGIMSLKPNLGLNIFPNPTSSYFQLNSTTEIKDIWIYNSSGQLVWNEHQSEGFKSKTIELNEFADGMYILVAAGDEFVVTEKVQVMR